MKSYKFDAEIKKVEGINGAYIEVPLDVKKEFGKGKVLISATFDGEKYDGQMVKMGTPCHIIGVTKAIREKIGKQAGDKISVTIAEREARTQTFANVDEYLLSYKNEHLPRLELLRQTILKCSPLIEEKISWSMPTYVYNGILAHFALAKNHIGFYPTPSAIEKFKSRIQNVYKYSKGAVQLPNDKALPLDLIQEIIIFKLKENEKNG